jgi:hypothetical protein
MPKQIKQQAVRKVGTVPVKSAAKKPSKPVKLSKSDPDYFKKIGLISAQKRKMTSADFSEMAKRSHPRPRSSYRGGRPKSKQAEATE